MGSIIIPSFTHSSEENKTTYPPEIQSPADSHIFYFPRLTHIPTCRRRSGIERERGGEDGGREGELMEVTMYNKFVGAGEEGSENLYKYARQSSPMRWESDPTAELQRFCSEQAARRAGHSCFFCRAGILWVFSPAGRPFLPG